ncbi:hypothetical protein DQ384_05485 [Sphaerisporangium album]|uniref:Uncharacterized protein n=1 Tax=Sphaerisporangium album TaxID=509200 RepID=A0A367FQV5_9ACTN|nr:hypothetical protein [Sphaerisporangium album]RCG31995.1 hypothetical protein DQ384_05485 [Sphaerisporangium album]
MAKSGYSITTGSTVSLTALTPRSVLGVKAGAQFGADLKKFRIGFEGTLPTAAVVLVEVCAATFITNAPSSASTTVNVNQAYGRLPGTGFSAAKAWTSEPTILTPLEEYPITPFAGLLPYDFPLGDTPDSALGEGFVIRVTSPAGPLNCRASAWFERC